MPKPDMIKSIKIFASMSLIHNYKTDILEMI